MATEQVFTPMGYSYWDEKGIFQKQYDDLYQKLVPSQGMAETLNGELIRAISRLQYEYCNNGNINAYETEYVDVEYDCPSCGGSGTTEYENEEEDCQDCGGCGTITEEEEKDVEITPMYSNFLELIGKTINTPEIKSIISQVESIIPRGRHNRESYFNEVNMYAYTQLNDRVIYYVLTHEDKELPEWYEN